MTKNNTESISLAGKKTLILILSLAIIAVGVLLALLKGINFNTDFGGGAALTVQFSKEPTQADIDKAVNAVRNNTTAKLISAQKYSTDSLLIRTTPMPDCAKVRTAVASALSLKEDFVKAENTPRTVGKDAILSVAISLLIAGGIVLVYFAFRFGILPAVGTLFGFAVMAGLWLISYSTFGLLDFRGFTVFAVGIALYVIESACVLNKKVKKASDIDLAPSMRNILLITAIAVIACLILAFVGNLHHITLPLSIMALGACFASLFSTGSFVLMFKK